MSFAIIRVQPVRSAAAADKHNLRKYDPEHTPDNIRPGEQGPFGMNSYYVRGDDYQEKGTTIGQAIQERFAEAGVKPRSNSVQALEYVVSASPDFWAKVAEGYHPDAILSKMTKFITDKHGMDNVVSICYHFDESTPHAHVVVTPIVSKEVNYGGKATKKNRLCARDFINGPEQLSQLQTDFHEHINAFTTSRLGYELHRGAVKEKNRISEYTKSTDHEIGALRASMAAISADLDKGIERSEDLRAKQQELARLQQDLDKSRESAARREDVAKVNWKKFDHLQQHLVPKKGPKKNRGFNR